MKCYMFHLILSVSLRRDIYVKSLNKERKLCIVYLPDHTEESYILSFKPFHFDVRLFMHCIY